MNIREYALLSFLEGISLYEVYSSEEAIKNLKEIDPEFPSTGHTPDVLKQFRRKISRAHHPDLTPDEAEKIRRTERLKKANASLDYIEKHGSEHVTPVPGGFRAGTSGGFAGRTYGDTTGSTRGGSGGSWEDEFEDILRRHGYRGRRGEGTTGGSEGPHWTDYGERVRRESAARAESEAARSAAFRDALKSRAKVYGALGATWLGIWGAHKLWKHFQKKKKKKVA